MGYYELVVVLCKDGINHIDRITIYVDIKKGEKPKFISLLANDLYDTGDHSCPKPSLAASLFRQIKQNFPLRYYYGECANVIKIQIWVPFITNLLVLQSVLKNIEAFRD